MNCPACKNELKQKEKTIFDCNNSKCPINSVIISLKEPKYTQYREKRELNALGWNL